MIFGKNVNHYYFKYFYLLLVGIMALLFVDYIQTLLPENYGNLVDAIKNSLALKNDGIEPNNGLLLTKSFVIEIVINVLMIAIGMFVGRFLWRIAILNLGVNVETDLRKRMFLKMEMLSQDYFQLHKTGAQMALYTNDLMCINSCFTDGIIMFVDALFLGGIAIYKMLKLNVALTLFASIPLAIIGLCGGLIGKLIDKRFEARQKSYEKLSDFAQENFSGLAVIKAFVKEKLELQEFVKNNKDFSKTNIAFTKLIVGLNVFFTALVSSIVVIIVGYGSHLIITTKGMDTPFTSGSLITFISYFGLLTWPALALGNLINLFSEGRASLRRINELLEYPILVKDQSDVIEDVDLVGEIEFRHLNFKYPGSDHEVLKDISFDVSVGDIIAIVGPSGSGKSTLLRCLNMIEVPSSGKIIFEGIDITSKNTDLPKVREKIGMVFQQFNLFPHLTVLDNIILAPVKLGIMDKDSAIKRAEELLKETSLLDKKDNYPEELSGGQKQRVAIVRSLIMNPDIILFDEPTSALDPEMVGDVLELIKKVADTGMTMIVVSHEMNFVKKCASRVLFIDNGKIALDGTPKEVFNNKDNERLMEFLNKTNN